MTGDGETCTLATLVEFPLSCEYAANPPMPITAISSRAVAKISVRFGPAGAGVCQAGAGAPLGSYAGAWKTGCCSCGGAGATTGSTACGIGWASQEGCSAAGAGAATGAAADGIGCHTWPSHQ